MLFQGLLFLTLLLQFANSIPLKDKKVEPVELNYKCIKAEEDKMDKNKSPILLIHGLSSSLENWNGVDQVLALGTGRRVCAVDLRNHGGSPWSNRTDIAALVADIKLFLDKQNIEKVNIIGHSLGGKTAVDFTLKYPQHVDSVVVEDMRPNGITDLACGKIKMMFYLLKAVVQAIPEGSDEQEAEKFILDKMNEKIKELGLQLKLNENIDSLPIQCAEGKCRFTFNIDAFLPLLDNVTDFVDKTEGVYEGPVLFIYGKKSEVDVGSDAENILKLFPNAKLVGVEGAGHVIHGMYREFDDEVIKFLNK